MSLREEFDSDRRRNGVRLVYRSELLPRGGNVLQNRCAGDA